MIPSRARQQAVVTVPPIARLTLAALLLSQLALADRRQDLDTLLKILPPTKTKITGRISAVDKSWEDWQRRTGELPPVFEAMPSQPFLPDPLHGVKDKDDWKLKRQSIREDFEKWITGRMPPPPGNLRATVTAEKHEGGVTVRDVLLEFGPDHRAKLRVQLMIPPGHGPFPVFLTNHPRTKPWVNTAVRRGYIGCIYFATDPMYGNDDDSDKFIEVYPEYDFSCLARWAWAAMRAVDYLYTLPEVDKAKIGISGHSRNGKQALIAAAFDERIGAVVPSSGNTGEGNPWRYTTDMFAAESIEQITGNFPHWFHPRLRFFAGREHRLPVDQNSLMALVAPRGLMLASAFSEGQGNPFGFEQAYRSAREVYRFLGDEDKIGLYLRAGEHPTTAADIETFVDFFDDVFGRRPHQKIETWVNGYEWRKSLASREPAGNPVAWALGQEPPGVHFPAASKPVSPRVSDGWLRFLYKRPLRDPRMASAEVAFGDDLLADLYYPAKPAGKLPLVIWLHGYSYATGYSRHALQPFRELVGRGYAVLAFDQIGFGTRVEDARDFYDRYPNWSLLGKMVADTRAAIDAAAAMEMVDASRIYLVGYALGGKVALWTAAQDHRPAAVVSVAGFTPLRTATADKGTEGIRHYSHLHGLVPQFGTYVGREKQLPIDYDDLLTSIGSRPVLVVAPQFDRYATLVDIRQMVEKVAARKTKITLETPLDFNRFPVETQKLVFDWLDARRKP